MQLSSRGPGVGGDSTVVAVTVSPATATVTFSGSWSRAAVTRMSPAGKAPAIRQLAVAAVPASRMAGAWS